MKGLTRNQRALKLLLFVALVGNISFEPIRRGIESMDLSQQAAVDDQRGVTRRQPTEPGQTRGAAPAQQAAAPAQQAAAPAQQAAAPAQQAAAPAPQAAAPAPQAAAPAPQAAAPTGQAAAPTAPSVDNLRPPSAEELARMQEEIRRLRSEAEAERNRREEIERRQAQLAEDARRRAEGESVGNNREVNLCNGRRGLIRYFRRDGRIEARGSESNCTNCLISVRAVNTDTLTDHVQNRLADELRSVLDRAAGCENRTADATEDRETRAEIEEQRKTNEEKVKNCEMKRVGSGRTARYEELNEDESLRCNVRRIATMRPDRGESNNAFVARVRELIREKIREPIKDMLLDSDERRYERGREYADEMIRGLTRLRSMGGISETHRHNLTQTMELFSGYKTGGETARRSREYQERASDLRDGMRQAYNEALRNPLNPAATMRLQMYRGMHMGLANEIQYELTNGPYRALLTHQLNPMFSSNDMNAFLTPYRSLEQTMLEAIDMNAPGARLAGLPGNLASLRGGDAFLSTGRNIPFGLSRSPIGLPGQNIRFGGPQGRSPWFNQDQRPWLNQQRGPWANQNVQWGRPGFSGAPFRPGFQSGSYGQRVY